MTTPTTDGAALELAQHYVVPAAAAHLILAAASPVRSEERYRAQAALRALDPGQDFDVLIGDTSPPPWALAVGAACTEIALYIGCGLGRDERARGARLLGGLCKEATRLRALRAREAA